MSLLLLSVSLFAVAIAVAATVTPLHPHAAFISTSITFFNKAVLASYGFKWPNLMTLVQMVFSLLFLVALRAAGAISFPKPNWAMSKRVLPLSLAFCAMVLTGLGALKYLNIPVRKQQ